ncbi:protein-methionine-sulfoxide reductase heme-binding subunit MsrQ [Marivivens donghaensis]|uniref:Protein-methionine-sulfoxide reductase heme-binding subunit MsrQ n=1 Tax=Marivivens donghaensis TaxID=1699413 RepID=A0ABX0VZB4_9RHOB|nr:protein-methionine-sulfoxide reductase heme-binding subunit MsrQ [Marivivens donghaensis]NIY73159.1 protein-methionine-sulfoxide reductase heme-binding subunit MsrQ [Marivivens donghaensis]
MSVADHINRVSRRIPPWTIYIAALAWAGWLFWLGLSGNLGPEPINALEREYGSIALKLLIAGLCVTPLRTYFGVNLLRFRRQIGLSAFFFVVAHFSVWALLDVQSFGRVWTEIVKRPYVTVGMAALVMLIPLALTSNNASIRKLGKNWRRLHWLTYPIAVLAGIHYVWLVKGFPWEPFIYMAIIVVLLALRFLPKRKKSASKRSGQPQSAR